LDDAIDVNNDNHYEVPSSSLKEKKVTTDIADIVDVAIVTPTNSPGRHNNEKRIITIAMMREVQVMKMVIKMIVIILFMTF